MFVPYRVDKSESQGRYIVADRDLHPGEIILTEEPLLICPTMELPCSMGTCQYPTCLGCCHILSQVQDEPGNFPKCSQCLWPICGVTCETNSTHASFECQIFRQQHIPPLLQPQRYQMIQILRFCLLKTKNPSVYAKLLQLESHVESRRSQLNSKISQRESQFTQQVFTFVHDICKVDNVEWEEVNYLVGVSWVNSFGGDATIHSNKRRCSLVFSTLSMLNHSCVPNTRLILRETTNEENDSGFVGIQAELRASVLIPQNTEITQQYVNVLKGTTERQKDLSSSWYFHCDCSRCSDPTELQTYTSGVKCTSSLVSNCPGYLLPEKHLGWKCDCCYLNVPHEQVMSTLLKIRNQVSSARDNVPKLYSILNLVENTMLHKNHWIVMELKYEILEELICLMSKAECDRLSPDEVNVSCQAIPFCRHLLYVANVLLPGQSTYRGVLTYFLTFFIRHIYPAQFLHENHEHQETFELSSKNGVKRNGKVLNGTQVILSECDQCLLKEAFATLGSEPEGTTYKGMAAKIQEFLNLTSTS